jgi:hypothetical protein
LLDPAPGPSSFGHVLQECIEEKRGYPAVPDSMGELLWLSNLAYAGSGTPAGTQAGSAENDGLVFYLGVHDVEGSEIIQRVYGRKPWPGNFYPTSSSGMSPLISWSDLTRCTFLEWGSAQASNPNSPKRSWKTFAEGHQNWVNGNCVTSTVSGQTPAEQKASGLCERALRPVGDHLACHDTGQLPPNMESFEWNSQW